MLKTKGTINRVATEGEDLFINIETDVSVDGKRGAGHLF